MTAREPSVAGLALSGLLWAAAVILTSILGYSLLAPEWICDTSRDWGSDVSAREVHAVYQWPPPIIRCKTGFDLLPGSGDETIAELWDTPALIAIAVIDVLAVAELYRRQRTRRRRLGPAFARAEAGWPPRLRDLDP